jgi:hypothetical protein
MWRFYLLMQHFQDTGQGRMPGSFASSFTTSQTCSFGFVPIPKFTNIYAFQQAFVAKTQTEQPCNEHNAFQSF